MPDESFAERLRRIEAADTAISAPAGQIGSRGPTGPGRRAPGFGTVLALALLAVPFGIAARILRQIYMEITPEAVHFASLLGFVVASHLVLFVGGALAVFTFRKWPRFGWFVLLCWSGYGMGAAMLTVMGRT